MSQIRIYTMTHKKFTPPTDPVYVPLQVGRALHEDLGYPSDDTGDHISDLNPYYGELTGVYWVWKNDRTSDIIGICHYRRYFLNEQGELLKAADYERLLADADVITSDIVTDNAHTNEENFARAHTPEDMQIIGETIKRIYPEDYESFQQVMQDSGCCYGNLMVTKRALFEEYCTWLFTILVEAADKLTLTGRDEYHTRLFGFLSEVLLQVWIRARGLRQCPCKIGITAEKAETLELKETLFALIQSGRYEEAKTLFYDYVARRPDVRESLSDIHGELSMSEQLIFLLLQEKKAGLCTLQPFASDKELLFAHYKNIRRFVAKIDARITDEKEAVHEIRKAGEIYFKEMQVSDLVLSLVWEEMKGQQNLFFYLNEGKEPPKVSVIVPVYNGVGQFEGCLGNLVHQTLEEIEILFVDDCSTDDSLKVLYECRRQYPGKVRVIASPKNRRAGGARNLALDAATGEYIGFVDCDDLPELTMFEKLYEKAKETDADFVDGAFLYDEQNTVSLFTGDENCGEQTAETRKSLILIGGYLWSKLVKRSLIEETHLRFRENVPMLEDADFLDVIWAKAKKVSNVKEVIYRYKNTDNSLSKKRNTPVYVGCLYEAVRAIYDKTHKLHVYQSIREALEYEYTQMLSFAINACLESYQKGEDFDCLAWLKKLQKLRKEVLPKEYRNPYTHSRLQELDIAILQMNDEDPKRLMHAAKELGWNFTHERKETDDESGC